MTLELFYEFARKAGFCFWGGEEWRPKGAMIDWAAQYDEEMVELFHLIKNHYEEEKSNVQVDLTDEELLTIFKMAHERDITLNQMINIVIMNAMKDTKWTEGNSLEVRDSSEDC
jgi:hypothetical protein